jgi:drug/metabolite transporter (DMT)-like permease
VQLAVGLVLAFVSAVGVNWAYSHEHDAAAAMPAFSPRQPVRFVRLLVSDRRWLRAFAVETAGWLVYVAALALAPLSLVQAICASGIAVLALVSVRGRPQRLARHEKLAVGVAFAGLVLLSLSIVDTHQADYAPHPAALVLWLGVLFVVAVALGRRRAGLAAGPALGLAAGLFFAGGDISAKLVVYGGPWLAAAATLVLFYALGTSVLQGSFQHANALTGAGLATLTTNAVPIAAGFVLLDESLPGGAAGVMQVAAFACIVLSATAIADPRARDASGDPDLHGEMQVDTVS